MSGFVASANYLIFKDFEDYVKGKKTMETVSGL